MKEKRKRRKKQIESIFETYNGSAVEYHTPKTSNKSISQICRAGSTIAKGTSIGELINEIRK